MNKRTDGFPCQTAALTLTNDTIALEPLRRLVDLSERCEFRMQMAAPEGAGQLGGLEVVQHDKRERARFYAESAMSVSPSSLERVRICYPLVVYLLGVCNRLLPGGAGYKLE